jgi:hypothetical protein
LQRLRQGLESGNPDSASAANEPDSASSPQGLRIRY